MYLTPSKAGARVNPILIGERALIEIEPCHAPGGLAEGSVAATDKRRIRIAIAGDARAMIPVGGCRASLTISRHDGLRVLRGRAMSQSGDSITFVPSEAALRVQRRRDFRLPLIRTVRIVMPEGSDRAANKFAELLDLSGGGAQIGCVFALAEGKRIQLSVPMGVSGDEGWVDALVLSCAAAGQRGTGEPVRFVARLTFDDDLGRVLLSEQHRDEIVRYLFTEQRAMLKLRRLLAPAEETPQRPGSIALILKKLRGAF